MKQFLAVVLLVLLSATQEQALAQTTQDTIYFWKAGTLLLKQSIKAADLDSITFKRPATVPIIPTVTIGTQVWTTTNLDVTTYTDGTPIPQVTDPTEWATLSTGAWCYYNNDAANGSTYGKLYNWYAVAGIHDNDPTTPNKTLAPTGYHIPTDTEWDTLITFLGGRDVAGGKMKETGTAHWEYSPYEATNSSGFTALPGGYRDSWHSFSSIRWYGYWWSSSDNGSYGWQLNLESYMRNAYIDQSIKSYGFSVRCLRD
jgi:uncharacterized protein (TIGR02145 family)